MNMIKEVAPYLALVVAIISLLMNRRKTGAEVENIRVSTDDKRFDTLKKELEILQRTVDERGKRNEQLVKEMNEERTRLQMEADDERKACAEQMIDMSTMWELKFKSQEKRIAELEAKTKK